MVQKTKCVKANRNPVWCVGHHCLFLIETDKIAPFHSKEHRSTDENDERLSVMASSILPRVSDDNDGDDDLFHNDDAER